jgi:hypothetical protein
MDLETAGLARDSGIVRGSSLMGEGRAYPERRTFSIGFEGAIPDIIAGADTAAHGSQLAARLELLEMPQAGCGVGLFGVREDS